MYNVGICVCVCNMSFISRKDSQWSPHGLALWSLGCQWFQIHTISFRPFHESWILQNQAAIGWWMIQNTLYWWTKSWTPRNRLKVKSINTNFIKPYPSTTMYFKTSPLHYLVAPHSTTWPEKPSHSRTIPLCAARAASNLGFPQVATSHLGEAHLGKWERKQLKAIWSRVTPNRWKAKCGKPY